MSATNLAALAVIVAGYAGGIFATLFYLGSRIDGLAREVGDLRVDVGRIGQRLDDHATNHPGPTERIIH